MSSIRIQLLVCVSLMESNNVCVLGVCIRIRVYAYMGVFVYGWVFVHARVCAGVYMYACVRDLVCVYAGCAGAGGTIPHRGAQICPRA